MGKLSQTRAPIYEALERFRRNRIVPFDVPGHKHGRGNPELVELLGERCVSIDVNSMKPLDNLCHPVSVIKEAEELAAEAFGADHAFLMVGGTTSAVQSMILSCCKKNDKIILPRNVHRSAINAMVLCGAKPVYVNPDVDQKLGISLGMKRQDVLDAIEKNPELVELLGERCVSIDVNSMKPLDNLCHPVSVIKEAEELAAEAFGADHAFLMVGGTTSAVQSMILSCCKKNDKIILPRNVHRSAINAMVLCGAKPVYVNPDVDQKLGISLGMKRQDVLDAIEKNPDAVAVLVNNPTYYGICSDLRAIVKAAHEKGMLVLADEAHGTHFYFGKDLPVSAMAAGADIASVSMHKSGGSLTQSSFLLTGKGVNPGHIRQIINLTQTTSGSYLLLSSLDISRRNLALRGEQSFRAVTSLADYAREEINRIGDYYAFGREMINGDSIFDFDPTKLSIHTLDIGLAGIEVYDILRDEYDIQIEFGDLGNILAYLSIGDRIRELERLVTALADIKRRYKKDKTGMLSQEYISPKVVMTPQDSFYAEKESLMLEEAAGRICSEFVMCYPPGIPVLAPGEEITDEIINYIVYAKEKGCSMTGPEDERIERLNVLREK